MSKFQMEMCTFTVYSECCCALISLFQSFRGNAKCLLGNAKVCEGTQKVCEATQKVCEATQKVCKGTQRLRGNNTFSFPPKVFAFPPIFAFPHKAIFILCEATQRLRGLVKYCVPTQKVCVGTQRLRGNAIILRYLANFLRGHAIEKSIFLMSSQYRRTQQMLKENTFCQ